MACDFCRSLSTPTTSCPVCTSPMSWEQARALLPTRRASPTSRPQRSTKRQRPVAVQLPPAPLPRPAPLPAPRPTPRPVPSVNPWQDEKTEIVTPEPAPIAACGKPVDLGLSAPSPCALISGHHEPCSAFKAPALPTIQRPAASAPLRALPRPAVASVATVWSEIPPSSRASQAPGSKTIRAALLERIRIAFNGTLGQEANPMLGILMVCQIAGRSEFPARKAEILEIDTRAELTGLLPADDRRRWQLFDAAVSELGFDPRQSDDAPAGAGPVDGAAMLRDILGG